MEWNVETAKKDPVLSALTYLKRENSIQTLQTIRDNQEKGNYFVAFIGQFSSGKSSLINSLLDRDLLPQGIKETTPLLTYIRYGSPEMAVFHYQNGSEQERNLDEVKGIIQSGEGSDWNELDYLELFVDVDALREGMILLDTPGINTVIERHELLLANSMDLASRIIYVTKGAPDQVDVSTMAGLAERGFKLAFVRTHFDTLLKSEESDEEAIESDRKVLNNAGITPSESYWVSNQKGSNAYQGVVELRNKLAEIGKNAQSELMNASKQHMSLLTRSCIKELNERKEALEDVKAGKDKEVMDRLTKCQEQIQSFEKMVERKQKKLNEEMADGIRELRGPVRDRLGQDIERAVKRISDPDNNTKTTEQMTLVIHNEAVKLGAGANEAIDSVVVPLMHGVLDEQEMKEYDFCIEDIPTIDSYAELAQTQNDELEQLKTSLEDLRKNREQLESRLQEMTNGPEYQGLQADLGKLEQEIMEWRTQYENLPPYEPNMIEVDDGRLQPSQVTKMIGNATDWLLLFLPGTTISNGLKVLSESEKATKWLGKFGAKLGKLAEAAKTADAVKDQAFSLRTVKNWIDNTRASKKRTAKVAQTLKTASGVVQTVEESVDKVKNQGGALGFLEYLTIQHWAEKIGKPFDRPPVLKEDPEFKAAYQAEKKRIYEELQKKQEDQFKKQCEYGLFETEAAKIEAQRKASIVDEQRIQETLAQREKDIRAKVEIESLRKWKYDCAVRFRDNTTAQIDRMIKDCCDSLPSRLLRYQSEALKSVKDRLVQQQSEYQRLSQMPETDADLELSFVNALIAGLNRVS